MIFNSPVLLNKKIRISQHDWDVLQGDIERFVGNMKKPDQSFGFYKNRRNAYDPAKDIRNGKIGELFLLFYLQSLGFPTAVSIDFSVYGKDKKDWSADLPFRRYNFAFPDVHVKTCTWETLKFSNKPSWTFQSTDYLFDNPDTNDRIGLMFIDKEENVWVIGIGPWSSIYPILKDPVLKKHRGKKKCLYYEDFERLCDESRKRAKVDPVRCSG